MFYEDALSLRMIGFKTYLCQVFPSMGASVFLKLPTLASDDDDDDSV